MKLFTRGHFLVKKQGVFGDATLCSMANNFRKEKDKHIILFPSERRQSIDVFCRVGVDLDIENYFLWILKSQSKSWKTLIIQGFLHWNWLPGNELSIFFKSDLKSEYTIEFPMCENTKNDAIFKFIPCLVQKKSDCEIFIWRWRPYWILARLRHFGTFLSSVYSRFGFSTLEYP